jgi:FtsP/CotA-like multicopper oxidase with cupredoxin domain
MIDNGNRLEILVKRMRPSATKRSNGNAAVRWGLASTLMFCALLTLDARPVFAQGTLTRTAPCLAEGQILQNPPEIESSGGILKGTIVLKNERQGLSESSGGQITCAGGEEGVWVRNFRAEPATREKWPPVPAQPPHARLSDPEPGPTLRARVGDLVQLTFLNEVNPNNFDPNIDVQKCTEVGTGAEQYPKSFFDTWVNCLHASSTANIHFHGTHTNPNSTGDNVYLQVRPLPRDNQGTPTVARAEATAGFAEFFRRCTEELQNPLHSWPATWDDVPKAWTDKQKELLLAHQQKDPTQRLWDENQEKLKDDWPIYYIGAFPYCFALPEYRGPSGARPVMGQIPGTHWYHAHKHGSTAINVANGMTGAFIIEGQYDDNLNAAYKDFYLEKGGERIRWNARAQPILVLNQLATDLNPTSSQGPPWSALDFAVNGRIRPKLRMQLGEVQLWRIVNTSSRSAAYFMPPSGLQWRQVAQDGVQLADANYQKSLNQPLYVAPANRVDLLVKAPATPLTTKVMVKNVMSRSDITSASEVELLTVEVAGPPVTLIGGQTAEMQLLTKMFDLPEFLNNISDRELELNNVRTRTFTFNSKPPKTTNKQHTINGLHFDEGHAEIRVLLDTTEEWKIVNTTSPPPTGPGNIDHPLHIHINPFQVTELFDPNEKIPDPATGLPGTRPQYVFDERVTRDPDQCFVDPREPSTWKPCAKRKERMQQPWVWHDVFAIPSGWDAVDKDNNPITEIVDGKERQIVIPGYYKMRSRFVDFPGLYVMHCHILIHEDRGMMFSVEVVKANPREVKHH